MEEGQKEIEGIMQRTGLTEEEARARYHLRKAFDALVEVGRTPVAPDEDPFDDFYVLTDIAPHFEALENFLARRVLERERPEGWGRGGIVIEED